MSETPRKRWPDFLLGIGVATAMTLLYTMGKDNGKASMEQAIQLEQTKAQRELAQREAEIQQLTRLNASLQATLQLSDKDRERLLSAAAVEPPVTFSVDGVPLTGKVTIPGRYLSSNCIDMPVTLENTSMRNVAGIGAEVMVPPKYWGGEDPTPTPAPAPARRGEMFARHWIRAEGVLSPGARRWSSLHICKGHWKSGKLVRESRADELVNDSFADGEEIPVTYSFFAEGFLPLRGTFTLVIRDPPPLKPPGK